MPNQLSEAEPCRMLAAQPSTYACGTVETRDAGSSKCADSLQTHAHQLTTRSSLPEQGKLKSQRWCLPALGGLDNPLNAKIYFKIAMEGKADRSAKGRLPLTKDEWHSTPSSDSEVRNNTKPTAAMLQVGHVLTCSSISTRGCIRQSSFAWSVGCTIAIFST